MKTKAKKNTVRQHKHIRNGDKVMVISGNDRGHVGSVLSRSNDRITVQGANVRKKHVKRTQENPNNGILELEKPIHISKVKLCIDDQTPVKLRVRNDEDGNRELFYKQGDKLTTYRSLKKGA